MPGRSIEFEVLLDDLRTALEDLYGDRLVLYGSQSKTTSSLPFRAQARGDTHKESDVDVIVVLERPVEPSPEIRRMRDIRTRLGLQHGHALSLLPVSKTAYQNRSSTWLSNARRDGEAV